MKCRLVSFILLLAGACTLAAQQTDAQLIDAVQLYSNGQVKQAREKLRTLSVLAPQDDAVWYYLALTESASNDLTAAEEAMRNAVALDSTNYWYGRYLARLELVNDKVDQSITRYEALVKNFPDHNDAVYELLDIYLAKKEYEKALAALEEIEQQRGPSEEVVRTQYDLFTAMGRQEEGAARLEQYNQQYSSPAILSMLGDYYLADFSDSLARCRYQEALSLDSHYVPALLGISEVYRHQRNYPEYFATLQPFFASEDIPAEAKSMYIGNLTRGIDPKILQLHRSEFDSLMTTAAGAHPTDSTLIGSIGTYYYSTGRQAEADPWFRRCADLYPDSLPQTATYVQYLSLQQRWEELRERSEAAYDRFGELAFLDYANMASYQLEDYDAIIKNCEYLIARYPKDKELLLGAYAMLGDAWYSKGNAAQAYKAYDKALKFNPDYAPVLNNYAYYLSLEGKSLKKAYNMSRKTVEAEPDNATYLDTFGWILHLQGKDVEAKPLFKHAMLYGGKESAVILRHYALVLESLGEEDAAKIYHQQADRLEAREKP